MRTMITVKVPVEKGNEAIQNGTLQAVIKSAMEKLKPEAAYFLPNNGLRSCMMVFDMKDPSEIPVIAEDFFIKLNAEVNFSPVMNIEDLEKGFAAMGTK